MRLPGAAPLVHYLGRCPELLAAWRHTPAAGRVAMRYLGVGKHQYPFRIRLTSGATLTLADAAEVSVFWQIFVRDCYTLPANCHTILDCGANVGIFSVWAAALRPSARIVAFEPFAQTFSALRSQIRDNNLDGRVECVQVALAGAPGQRWMNGSSDSPNRRLVPDDVPTVATELVPVQCMTLTEALETFGLRKLDLLKMDIEGSEWEVLLSTPPSVLRGIRHIQVEYHEIHKRFGHTPEKLFAHLEKAGHRLVRRIEDANRTGLAHLELLP